MLLQQRHTPQQLSRFPVPQREKTPVDTYSVLVYGDHFEQGEEYQSYAIGPKDTAQDLIKQILRRNHLNLKDPNLFFLTFRLNQTNIGPNYEPQYTTTPIRRPGDKGHLATLYSNAILSRTLNLNLDNRLTLHMQTGGVLRIYDNCFSKPPSIRQIYISKTTSSEEVIKLVLTIVGSTDDPQDYCLVEEEANDKSPGRILRDHDYPLLVSRTSGINGVLILRRRDEALKSQKCKKKTWLTRSKSSRTSNSDKPTEANEDENKSRNVIPRLFRSFRRNKVADQPQSNANTAAQNQRPPSSLRQASPAPFQMPQAKSPYRVHYDPMEKGALEDKHRSWVNPHYRSLDKHTFNTAMHNGLGPQDFNHSGSNWSLAPSGVFRTSLQGRQFPTPPLQSHRNSPNFNDLKARQATLPWTYKYRDEQTSSMRPSAPTPPNQPTYPGGNGSPIAPNGINRKLPPAPTAASYNDLFNRQATNLHQQEQQLTARPLHYANMARSSGTMNSVAPGTSELEKVWARRHIAGYKTIGTNQMNHNGSIESVQQVPQSQAAQQICYPSTVSQTSTREPYSRIGSTKPIPPRRNKRSSPITMINTAQDEISRSASPSRPSSKTPEQRTGRTPDPPRTLPPATEPNRSIGSPTKSPQPNRSNLYSTYAFPGVAQLLQQKSSQPRSSPVKRTTPISPNLTQPRQEEVTPTITVKSGGTEVVLPWKRQENGIHHYPRGDGERSTPTERALENNKAQSPAQFSYQPNSSTCGMSSNMHHSALNVTAYSTEKVFTLTARLPTPPKGQPGTTTHLKIALPTVIDIPDESFQNGSATTPSTQSPTNCIRSQRQEAIRGAPDRQDDSKQAHKVRMTRRQRNGSTLAAVPDNFKQSLSPTPYPSLFDVLHHCHVTRVLLDPNIPSNNNQLGLQLCLTKFPLDDIQRANNLQQLMETEIKRHSDRYTESGQNVSLTEGPKGPKPLLRPREGGAFKPVDYKSEQDGPHVVTIAEILPNTPASIEGSLMVGMILLEINGDALTHLKPSQSIQGKIKSPLELAQHHLQSAYRAAKRGHAPMVRITAARYHNKFGPENKVSKWERGSTLFRSSMSSQATQDQLTDSKQKLPNSIMTEQLNGATSLYSKKGFIILGNSNSSTKPRPSSARLTMDYESVSEVTEASSRTRTDTEGLREKLMWFPSGKNAEVTATDPRNGDGDSSVSSLA